MSNQTSPITPAKIYGDAGLIYLRAPAKIETKKMAQKRSKGTLSLNTSGSQSNQNMDPMRANITH